MEILEIRWHESARAFGLLLAGVLTRTSSQIIQYNKLTTRSIQLSELNWGLLFHPVPSWQNGLAATTIFCVRVLIMACWCTCCKATSVHTSILWVSDSVYKRYPVQFVPYLLVFNGNNINMHNDTIFNGNNINNDTLVVRWKVLLPSKVSS